jgi:pyruvate,orthophosphate dikinase
MTTMVHLFGGDATTAERSKDLLGGKGANLAEMASIGLPVPPGFTITTECAHRYYEMASNFPTA